MAETMEAANGAGLAAIQVGAPVALFIIDGAVAGGAEARPPKVFINPEIVENLAGGADRRRGLPVVPRIFVPVKRGMRRSAAAMDLDGKNVRAGGEALYRRAPFSTRPIT
jgi:peptide deformylase